MPSAKSAPRRVPEWVRRTHSRSLVNDEESRERRKKEKKEKKKKRKDEKVGAPFDRRMPGAQTAAGSLAVAPAAITHGGPTPSRMVPARGHHA